MYKLFLILSLGLMLFSPSNSLVENYNTRANNWLGSNHSDQKTGQSKAAAVNWSLTTSPEAIKIPGTNFESRARARLALDLKSGLIIDTYNSQAKLPVASLTKLMTAYITLREAKLDQTMIVPILKNQAGDSLVGLYPKEQLKMDSLLQGLLINSGSDAAQTLAIEIAGSEDAFINKMNQAATNLNLQETHFSNPVGWDKADNYSSARDMANLTQVLLRNKRFREIVATKTTTIQTQAGRLIPLSNTNLLVGQNGYVGVKTGYTTGAGECLVALRKSGQIEILTVIIGSSDRFGQTASFLGWINSSFLW